MAWVTRRGREYYYGHQDGVKVYVGSSNDPLARLKALRDEEPRLRRDIAAEGRQAERGHLEAFDEKLNNLQRKAESIVEIALRSEGFHRHRRSELRKMRSEKEAM